MRINTPKVVSQVIDGEAVVINLETGAYYSLVGSAAAIWESLEQDLPASRIPAVLAGRFSASPGEIEATLLQFLQQLAREGLVVEDNEAETAAPEGAPALPVSVSQCAFEPPALTKYTDMEELIRLDPIHDADDAGWPQRAGGVAP